MSDLEAQSICSDVYNNFWNKWRKINLALDSNEEWDQIVAEAGTLIKKYNELPLVVDMVNDFLDELDARARKGGVKCKQ